MYYSWAYTHKGIPDGTAKVSQASFPFSLILSSVTTFGLASMAVVLALKSVSY